MALKCFYEFILNYILIKRGLKSWANYEITPVHGNHVLGFHKDHCTVVGFSPIYFLVNQPLVGAKTRRYGSVKWILIVNGKYHHSIIATVPISAFKFIFIQA